GHLFTLRNMNDMEEGKDYKDYLDPNSLVVVEDALVEPSAAAAAPLDKFQFLRHGYFCADKYTTPEKPVFNLTVSLKDSWGKDQKK
ncbi:MAG: glutamine--tRNA ligase, partial [Synergistes sp.]|nr:glutamine--tRNA ligase [Synergistes sp.]